MKHTTYEQFREIWIDSAAAASTEESIHASNSLSPICNGVSDDTATALIEYGKGNKTKIQEILKTLEFYH